MIQNREEIYKREAFIHDDESFDVRREENVNIFYKKPAFDDIIECAYKFIGDIKGKKLLEYGCGSGENIVDFTSRGSIYTGFDISTLRINRAKHLINELKLFDKANVYTMNAEKINFSDNSFDIIYAQAIIHHLDIETALKDIKRMLKPGGFAVFVEPRGNNPIINYFRKKSPDIRTLDEHPLLMKDFNSFKKYFKITQHNFYFLSLISLLFRKYFKSEFLFRFSKLILDISDRILFKIFPFSRKYAWYCVIKLY